MEEKITNIFDALDREETERLLQEDMDINLDVKTMNRIKKSVCKKIESDVLIQKKYNFSFGFWQNKKLIGSVVMVSIIFSSLFFIGFGNITAAIHQMFSLIPGYGIVEDTNGIEYILAEKVVLENGDEVFSIENAIATKDGITVMFSIHSKEDIEKVRYKFERIYKETSLEQEMILCAGDGRYKTECGSFTSSAGEDGFRNDGTFDFTMKEKDINTDIIYKLQLVESNISMEFKLKKYDSYRVLEQIGATGYNNDISLTAVPTFTKDKVEIDLYEINKSIYNMQSIVNDFDGYLGKNLQLETNSGTKKYTIPDGGNLKDKFIFDIKPSDRNFTLRIPHIIVQSEEEQNIKLKVPGDGEKVTVNQKVGFKDSTLTILDVEKTKSVDSGEYNQLKMTFKYDNKEKNKVMKGVELSRIDGRGKVQGGGWMGKVDKNDILTMAYFELEKGESTLRLKVSAPTYYLTDEYVLKFDR